MEVPGLEEGFSAYPINEDEISVYEGEDSRAVIDLIKKLSKIQDFKFLMYQDKEGDTHRDFKKFSDDIVDSCIGKSSSYELCVYNNKKGFSGVETYGEIDRGEYCLKMGGVWCGEEPLEADETIEGVLTILNE